MLKSEEQWQVRARECMLGMAGRRGEQLHHAEVSTGPQEASRPAQPFLTPWGMVCGERTRGLGGGRGVAVPCVAWLWCQCSGTSPVVKVCGGPGGPSLVVGGHQPGQWMAFFSFSLLSFLMASQ